MSNARLILRVITNAADNVWEKNPFVYVMPDSLGIRTNIGRTNWGEEDWPHVINSLAAIFGYEPSAIEESFRNLEDGETVQLFPTPNKLSGELLGMQKQTPWPTMPAFVIVDGYHLDKLPFPTKRLKLP